MALIDHLDHLVLTCVDPDATKHFYTEVLQMQLETFRGDRIAFRFGNQKINLHVRGREFEPKAHLPAPGARALAGTGRLGSRGWACANTCPVGPTPRASSSVV